MPFQTNDLDNETNGRSGNDFVRGGLGNANLLGRASNDLLSGGGNDWLKWGSGVDTLIGGVG